MAGNIKVIKPGKNYEQVSKAIIFDKRIDLAALGFFCKVISLSDRWQLNVAGLSTLMGISTGKVQKCLAELEDAGYLKREKVQGASGRFCGWDYTFYNLPIDTDNAENRQSENTDVGENRQSENQGVYNRPISNTKPIKENKTINKSAQFDFLSALISLGVSEPTATDWMEVRKASRAVNTRTAFDGIRREIEKAGASPEDCIRLAVEKNWRGFNAEWWQNAHRTQTPPPSPSPKSSKNDAFTDMMRRYGIIPDNPTNDTPDEQ